MDPVPVIGDVPNSDSTSRPGPARLNARLWSSLIVVFVSRYELDHALIEFHDEVDPEAIGPALQRRAR